MKNVILLCLISATLSFSLTKQDSIAIVQQYNDSAMTQLDFNRLMSHKISYRQFCHVRDSIFGPQKVVKSKVVPIKIDTN